VNESNQVIGGAKRRSNLTFVFNELTMTEKKEFLEENGIQSSYASRNKGIKNSKNEILCFTDSDVIVDKNWIKNGVRSLIELKKKGKKGVIFGKICLIGDPYQNIYTLYDYATGFRNLLATNNIFTYKEIFKKIGYFDESIPTGDDKILGITFNKNGEDIYYFRYIYVYTECYSNSISKFIKRRISKASKEIINFLNIYKRHPVGYNDLQAQY